MSLAALSLRMHTAGGALRFAAATSSCSAAHIRADAAARRFVRAISPCRCMATIRRASRPPAAARAPLVRTFAGVDPAAAAASAPVAAAVAPEPRVYSGLQMLEQLQELRSRNAPAAEQAAVAARFGGSAWSLDVLHEYLEPGETAPRAADALRAFEAATQELGVQPTAATFALLIRRLCAEWSAEQAVHLDLLRAKFSKCNPPLHFNKQQIVSLVSAALPHPEATLHLRQWAAVDHPRNAREWEQIQRTLRRVARATTPRAEPSVVAAEPHSHTLTVTPAKAGAAPAAAAQRSLTDALLSLLEEARHCADPSSPSASAGVEAAAAAASDGAWCRDALVAYLRCYTQLPGAEAALRTFRRVTDDLGVQPSAPLYGLMFRCLAVDWRPEHAAIIDQLRAVMLSQRPPLRFGELLITSMAPALSTRSQTAERLQRWAEEDGAWENLDPKVKRRIRSVALGAPSPSASGPPPPQPALRRRISELAEAGDFDGAGRLVAEAEAAGTSIDVKIMTAWLSCHERSGEWRGAEKVWQRMAELGLAPSAVSYRALIQVFTVNGEAEQLGKIDPLYDEMTNGSGLAGQPLHFSARDFEQLIKTAHRCRLAAEARKWADRTRAAGMWEQLDEASRRIVARAIEWEQQPRPVQQEEQQSALRNRLIALTAAGDWTQAERLVAEAEAAGTQLGVKIINAWLACYSCSGEWHGAERVWQRMAELSLAPDAASYCALMRAYTVNDKAEQLAKIEPLYTEMITGSGPAGAALQFSARDFGQLIKAAHCRRLVDQVLRWAERAKASGVWEQLDEASRYFAATAADKAENARAALREKQQIALRTGLVELAKAGDWAGAERLVAEAEASGTQINTRIATVWLACYTRSGEWRGAEAVWRRMAELSLAPDAASYCALMQVYMHSGEAEQLAKIEPLYTEMINGSGPAGQPLQLAVRDLEQMIKTARRCRLAAEARRWAERAKAAGLWEQLDKAIRRIVSTANHWGEDTSAALREEQESAPAMDSASLFQRGSQEQPARDDQHGKRDRDAPASVPTAAPASGRDARRSINALQTLVRRGVPLWGGETPAEMSAKIESIVHRLVKHSCHDGSDLTWAEWQDVLRAVLKHKLRGFALPLYIAMRLQQEEMVQRASPRRAPTPTPAKLRMPTACMRMLLQIALHSSVSQNAELHLGTASRAAINRFLASCPAPPPHVSATGSHRLALWMLEDMRTRGVVATATGKSGKEGVWSDRFDWSSAEPVNVVLAALCKRGGGIFAVADRMRSARELFSAMVVRDGTSYELFHEALRANGEHLAASEVDRMLLADRSRTSPACVALRLSKMRSRTTTPREHMLLQAEELWGELVDNPQQLLGVAATRAMLQLLQHCGADAARMYAVVEQALQLEVQVGAERQEAANPEGEMSDWEVVYAAPAPVAVDSACFELLLHAFATSAQPSAFAAEASAAYDNLLRRYAVAVACNAYRRAALLTPSASARCAFLHYLHRAGLYTQLVTVWRSLTTEQQHACADQVTAILLDLDQSGQPAEAEALSSRLQGQEEMPSTLEESQRSE